MKPVALLVWALGFWMIKDGMFGSLAPMVVIGIAGGLWMI